MLLWHMATNVKAEAGCLHAWTCVFTGYVTVSFGLWVYVLIQCVMIIIIIIIKVPQLNILYLTFITNYLF